jgi:hypothetical protein
MIGPFGQRAAGAQTSSGRTAPTGQTTLYSGTARTGTGVAGTAASRGVANLAPTSLGVDSRVAAASQAWNGRVQNGFHASSFSHHDDHHADGTFHASIYFGYPYYYGGYYGYGGYCGWNWGWNWCWGWNWNWWGCGGYPYCGSYCYGYPTYYPRYCGYYGYCYNPIGYSLVYPSYAYPLDYGSTTINNYYADPQPTDGSAPGAMLPDYHSYSSQAQTITSPRLPSPPGEDTATVYRSTADHGQMAWSDTAASIVNAMVATAADQRAAVAKQYLGRTPSGAWEVTFISRQDVEGATELTCRGNTPTTTGNCPTIVVRVNHTVQAVDVGQTLSVTGRLTELSVDDANNPGGLLVLENADVK